MIKKSGNSLISFALNRALTYNFGGGHHEIDRNKIVLRN
jgi:hypothetical protein